MNVHRLFEAQVARTPEAVAATHGGQTLTYRQLDERSSRLARHLGSLGVKPESLVVIASDRSLEMIVAVLGVLKAGGAYVPVDPDYPRERIAFILSDTTAPVVLTQRRHAARLPTPLAARIVFLDEPASWTGESEAAPAPLADPDALAYVLYTSGTTGAPKGVCIRHRGVCNLIHHAWNEYFHDGHLARALFSTSLCFDASVCELLLPLCHGGTVVIARDLMELAGPTPPSVTYINCTPSGLRWLLDAGAIPPTTRAVEVGGEYVSPSLIAALLELSHVELVLNSYGPTEATVQSTTMKYERNRPVPNTIGRPIANTEIHVLDPELRPVPLGVSGEICIGGAGVARGYLHRPELTRERFIENPFAATKGERLYRTGDLGRWQEGGTLEFLGRADAQIKLRGYRIELAEIEIVLGQHATVGEAAVVVWREQLVAYVVPVDQRGVDTAALREHLAARLPAFMVPSLILPLPSLPQTTQGKIDRQALPAPDEATARLPVYTFASDEERRVAALFTEVLGVAPKHADDDFVALGGTSLSAARLQAKVRQLFGKEAPLALFFQRLTVPKLAGFARGRTSAADLWIPLNEGDPSRFPPLIYPHSAGGLAQSARWLAPYLDPGVPFHTFNHPHDRPMNEWNSLEEMAAFYVRALCTKYPEGPLSFMGHSFGVLLAYEMARQLRAQGRAVTFLGIVDEPADPMPDLPDGFLRFVAAEHLLYYDAVVQGCSGVQERHRREMERQNDPRGLKLGRVFVRDVLMLLRQELRHRLLGKRRFAEAIARDYVRVMKEHGGDPGLGEPNFLIPLLDDLVFTIRLGDRYLRRLATGEFGRLDVPAWLFRATTLPPRTGTMRDDVFYWPPDGGWNRHLTAPIIPIACDGDHVTLQTEPHVRSLGKNVNEAVVAALRLARDA